MSAIPRFAAYAAAFERAFESDDWSEVEPYLDDAVVYEVGLEFLHAGPCEGRAAVLAYFKDVLDGFDRCFESRELTLLEGPVEEGDAVWIRGTATYRSEGLPDLVLELKETIHFEGDRIRRLEDEYTPQMKATVLEYVDAHGGALGFRRASGA